MAELEEVKKVKTTLIYLICDIKSFQMVFLQKGIKRF